MNLVEVVIACIIMILFLGILVQPLILLDDMNKELSEVRRETYELREELIQLQKQHAEDNGNGDR